MFPRTQGEKKHIMTFKISPVPTQEEYDAHFLEIVYSHLKLRQLQQKINGQVGASDGSLSKGGGLGIQGAAVTSSGSFDNKTMTKSMA